MHRQRRASRRRRPRRLGAERALSRSESGRRPCWNSIGRDPTQACRRGLAGPVIGREDETAWTHRGPGAKLEAQSGPARASGRGQDGHRRGPGSAHRRRPGPEAPPGRSHRGGADRPPTAGTQYAVSSRSGSATRRRGQRSPASSSSSTSPPPGRGRTDRRRHGRRPDPQAGPLRAATSPSSARPRRGVPHDDRCRAALARRFTTDRGPELDRAATRPILGQPSATGSPRAACTVR